MKKAMIICAFLTFCLVVASAFFSNTDKSRDNNQFNPAQVYETNENSQTYGSAMYAPSPDKEPDLILAEALDGTEGYVYASDLNADLPNNPEELLASMSKDQEIWDNAPVGQVVIARTIPLYAVDGKTIIGEFPITIGFKDSENAQLGGSLRLD